MAACPAHRASLGAGVMPVSSVEEARELLIELQRLQSEVLAKFPDAATSACDNDLPGQVTEADCTALPAPPPRSQSSGVDGWRIAAAEAIRAELSSGDMVRTWRDLVHEEVQRLSSGVHGCDDHANKETSDKVSGIYNADVALMGILHPPRTAPHPAEPAAVVAHEQAGDDCTGAETAAGAAHEKTPQGSAGEAVGSEGSEGDNELWVSVSENAYGAFIHVGLQSGFQQACFKCWLMLVISVVIAAVFAIELIDRHNFEAGRLTDRTGYFWITERSQICWIPWKLQWAASMIFITLIFNNIPGMLQAGRIALMSTHHKFGDGENVGEMVEDAGDAAEARPLTVGMPTRIAIFICAVMTEVITWAMILLSGILFIFTSVTVDLVIRSTVAVMFVLNVDEIVFESCCPTSIKDDVEETQYRIPQPKLSAGAKEIIKHYFGIYIYLPMLIGLTLAWVFVNRLRLECPAETGGVFDPVWQLHFNVSGVII